MADNVAITAGTGTSIAADDISSVQYQRIKLIHGADGTNDGDVATGNPLPVRSRMVTVTSTVTRAADTTTYSSGDAVGTSAAGGVVVTGMARASGGSGYITDMMAMWDDVTVTKMQGEVWLFNSPITVTADNSAFTCTDTEAKTLVAVIPFTLAAGPSQDFAHVQFRPIGFTTVGSADLYMAVVTRSACIPIANSSILTFRLKVLQVD